MRIYRAFVLLALLCISCSSERPPASSQDRKPAAPDPPKIQLFYASPGTIARGQSANICYGVSGVTSLRLEPPVEELKPALSRCFEVKPSATTTYRLIARGPAGETSAALTLKVDPRAKAPASTQASEKALILFFVTATPDQPRGVPVTLCYGVKDATSVRVEPGGPPLKPVEKSCFTVQPERTTRYTLFAAGPSGTDRQDLTITIR